MCLMCADFDTPQSHGIQNCEVEGNHTDAKLRSPWTLRGVPVLTSRADRETLCTGSGHANRRSRRVRPLPKEVLSIASGEEVR